MHLAKNKLIWIMVLLPLAQTIFLKVEDKTKTYNVAEGQKIIFMCKDSTHVAYFIENHTTSILYDRLNYTIEKNWYKLKDKVGYNITIFYSQTPSMAKLYLTIPRCKLELFYVYNFTNVYNSTQKQNKICITQKTVGGENAICLSAKSPSKYITQLSKLGLYVTIAATLSLLVVLIGTLPYII